MQSITIVLSLSNVCVQKKPTHFYYLVVYIMHYHVHIISVVWLFRDQLISYIRLALQTYFKVNKHMDWTRIQFN